MQNPQIQSKNLTILEEQMHQEALANKKCSVYAGYFTDPALKTLASQMSSHHKAHYDALLAYLNSHN